MDSLYKSFFTLFLIQKVSYVDPGLSMGRVFRLLSVWSRSNQNVTRDRFNCDHHCNMLQSPISFVYHLYDKVCGLDNISRCLHTWAESPPEHWQLNIRFREHILSKWQVFQSNTCRWGKYWALMIDLGTFHCNETHSFWPIYLLTKDEIVWRCRWLISFQLSIIKVNMSHIMRKPVIPYTNNKGADQPANPLFFAAWIVLIPLLAISEISRL